MKKILVALFMFCQFPFFVEALEEFEEVEEVEEAIETLDKLEELEDFEEFEEAIETLDKLEEVEEVEEVDRTDETIKPKSFYEIEYDDLFFEMGFLYNLYNKDDVKPILGMCAETKYKNSYIIFQNCIDLVYLFYTKNNAFAYADFVWTPTFFLGNSIIKIGVGTPLGIGGYIYEDNPSSFISIGARFSIKLTIGYIISLEAYYQGLEKGALGSDYTIESNEFGLTLKIISIDL